MVIIFYTSCTQVICWANDAK